MTSASYDGVAINATLRAQVETDYDSQLCDIVKPFTRSLGSLTRGARPACSRPEGGMDGDGTEQQVAPADPGPAGRPQRVGEDLLVEPLARRLGEIGVRRRVG